MGVILPEVISLSILFLFLVFYFGASWLLGWGIYKCYEYYDNKYKYIIQILIACFMILSSEWAIFSFKRIMLWHDMRSIIFYESNTSGECPEGQDVPTIKL